MAELMGKVAVVVGCSAPGGTGWAIAQRLAKEGATVVAAARSREKLEVLAEEIGGTAVTCDVAAEDDVVALASAVRDRYGAVDIAVNAAGLPVQTSIDDATLGDVQSALDVNYIGNVFFIREMGRIMNDHGSIVLISSSSAQQPVHDFFPYACAKAAMDCLVMYAATEYGKRGIRVNSVLPGPIRSDMASELWAVPGMEEVFAREVPLGRIGEPADYADVVLWLSGPAFVTGLNIPVSGGNQMTRAPRIDEMPMPE
ncbi:short-chain dehydrogenase [Novosphingobium marinum]|uniref:NAD(P)-dependent dehydrogenase (Short-subunit alcohol dehydrogenase family) n=1 Tax=Novosphingobium marinum TaxID=1514948 RepID=A0A7Y9XT55_9SPHN|nr:SDR family oxidoreductase [Novosphingobium marinum]NYH94002.1 NAD(P)-dependent dehydrogenase (short-subunit alcohol dehydrogenase family) [Novosphingobium marinum]GGC18839.1 short-chain dehydrogenase [Novosphingobium marinum]